MSPLRILVPAVAIAASVLGTYNLMQAIEPESGAAGGERSASGGGGGDGWLLEPDDLKEALDALEEEVGPEAELTSFRLAPERLDVIVARDGGGEIIQIRSGGNVTLRVGSPGGFGEGFSASVVDPRVPDRLIRRIGERENVDPGDVDYLTIAFDTIRRKPEWLVFFKGGETPEPYRSDIDGRKLKAPPD